MTKLPDVSVVVTCYNYGRYLERCIRSLLNQEPDGSFRYEIILVDDCSTDGTSVVAMKYQNLCDSVVYLRNPVNRGLPFSCNYGIDSSSGRYIVRVDADDYVSRHYLNLLKLVLDKNRTLQAIACDYYEVDSLERSLRQVSAGEEPIACGIMYRRECLYEVGLYNERFKYREGHELNHRFTQKFRIGNLPIPLYFARKHGDNRSLNAAQIKRFEDCIGKDKCPTTEEKDGSQQSDIHMRQQQLQAGIHDEEPRGSDDASALDRGSSGNIE